jgi:hypothetical protein
MSDFFDHLLQTGQGQANSLAPLPVSANEPAQTPAEISWDAVDLESERSTVRTGFAPSRPRPAEPGQPSPVMPPAAPDDGLRRRLDQLQSWLASMSSREPATPHSAQPPERPFNEFPVDSSVTPAAMHPLPAPPDRSSPLEQPELDPLQDRSLPQPEQVVREVVVRQPAPAVLRLAPQETARQPTQTPARQVEPAEQPPAISPPDRLVEITEIVRLKPRPAEYPPLPDRADLPIRHASQPSPRPVVQVTIGRIEVRAVRSPAPAPQAADRRSAASIMSLDEYLHRRNEGGRR